MPGAQILQQIVEQIAARWPLPEMMMRVGSSGSTGDSISIIDFSFSRATRQNFVASDRLTLSFKSFKLISMRIMPYVFTTFQSGNNLLMNC